ncbi:MAG TPA: hypothetical protein DIW31_05800 [Bacteroidales bacterium]|nr:hypothetical protein [Bacteroidales bacterium]
MSNLEKILEFFKTVSITTLSQLFWLFGLLFIIGFILYLIARFTRTTYVKTTGSTFDVFVTGWIGTPIHELGHAILCLIFRHKITEIKLYTPNTTDGTLGYVNHTYDSKSIYQKVGNFFIGIGPILFGAFVIYFLFYLLVPNNQEVFGSLDYQSKILIKGIHGKFNGIWESLSKSIIYTFNTLLTKANFSNYKFWVFLYLAFCISSHMELSPADIKGSWRGLLTIILLFFCVNLIIIGLETLGFSNHLGKWWHYIKLDSYALSINKFIGMFGAIFIFSTILSGLNFILTYIGLTIFSFFKGKGIVNPFW